MRDQEVKQLDGLQHAVAAARVLLHPGCKKFRAREHINSYAIGQTTFTMSQRSSRLQAKQRSL